MYIDMKKSRYWLKIYLVMCIYRYHFILNWSKNNLLYNSYNILLNSKFKTNVLCKNINDINSLRNIYSKLCRLQNYKVYFTFICLILFCHLKYKKKILSFSWNCLLFFMLGPWQYPVRHTLTKVKKYLNHCGFIKGTQLHF